MVVRDDKGRFLLAFGDNYLHWDTAQVELEAVYFIKNVVQDWMCEAQGLIIDGDNYNIINILQLALKNWKSSGRIDEKLGFLQDFYQVLFAYCNRDGNKLANVCANLAVVRDFIWYDLSVDDIPPSFLLCLKEECDSLDSSMASFIPSMTFNFGSERAGSQNQLQIEPAQDRVSLFVFQDDAKGVQVLCLLQEEAKEVQPSINVEGEEEESALVPTAPTPLCIESPLDHLVHRFDQWRHILTPMSLPRSNSMLRMKITSMLT
ncbi:hypothetical protein IEQ34_016872 [Dendrobium chrysotoxum]|uniref:RNase H type-1 domain-containing protein n=1 Tax=Dendrobium chrysotoxum TaxID=161865 RepID=A0AAV7GGT4_DENCH|nr:hypothetical protein IEQ34_016872 [Dendrobium chrysotoxum]